MVTPDRRRAAVTGLAEIGSPLRPLKRWVAQSSLLGSGAEGAGHLLIEAEEMLQTL